MHRPVIVDYSVYWLAYQAVGKPNHGGSLQT